VDREAFRTYLVAQLPSWLVVAVALALLYQTAVVPAWAAVLLLVFWIGSGVVIFPRVKHYYTAGPDSRPIPGATGVEASRLDPRGFVRIHGELWQATVLDSTATIAKGARVRVSAIDGLRLTVEPADPGTQPES
jgi:membrane-bound ClpP family serine protease